MGDTKGGSFDITRTQAHEMLLDAPILTDSQAAMLYSSLDQWTRRDSAESKSCGSSTSGMDVNGRGILLRSVRFEYLSRNMSGPIERRINGEAYRERWWIHVNMTGDARMRLPVFRDSS